MVPSWFIAKNTEPTVNAMHTVRFTLFVVRTNAAASRQVRQVFSLGSILGLIAAVLFRG
jgi:hypothetical protein